MKIYLLLLSVVLLAGCELKKTKSFEQERAEKDSIETAKKQKAATDRKEFENNCYLLDSIQSTKIKRIKVTRVSGKDDYDDGTTISYTTLMQSIKEGEKEARIEMRPDAELAKIKGLHTSLYPGGVINFSISRSIKISGDLSNFFVIVKDKDDNELQRLEHRRKYPPSKIRKGLYSNATTMPLETHPDLPFYVYVVDRGAQKQFKFKVDAVYK